MSEFIIGGLYDKAFQNLSKREIQDNLEAIAYELEERSYTKNLTEEEVRERKDDFSEINIELSELNLKKKQFLDNHKLQEKAIKSEASNLLDAIKYKSEQRFGKLYLIDDQEAGLMYTFDENGICVEKRALTRKEKQIKLKAAGNE